MYTRLKRKLNKVRNSLLLPLAAIREAASDRLGLPAHDPGIGRVLEEAVAWLGRAQDHSRSRDGGVSRDFSLIDGWASSYPETTGYIVPTLIAYAEHRNGERGEEARQRARRMLDWLVTIQFPEGGFQGGTIGASPVVPVTFNTGQILLGLAAGVEKFGEPYVEPMNRAADWLVKTQDPDGCWRRHPTPFAAPGEKAYETHVACGLLEADRVRPNARYRESALANIHWALGRQRMNGWFDQCCLTDPTQPLTHTIGYALRGVLEGYRASRGPALLRAAQRTADGALAALRPGGFLPGRLDARWRGSVRWACLTGSVQIAHCWLMIYQETGEPRYLDAACAANQYVRRTIKVEAPPETRGAVKGSFPVHGAYCSYEYPNWACKFVIDSNLLERQIVGEGGSS